MEFCYVSKICDILELCLVCCDQKNAKNITPLICLNLSVTGEVIWFVVFILISQRWMTKCYKSRKKSGSLGVWNKWGRPNVGVWISEKYIAWTLVVTQPNLQPNPGILSTASINLLFSSLCLGTSVKESLFTPQVIHYIFAEWKILILIN